MGKHNGKYNQDAQQDDSNDLAESHQKKRREQLAKYHNSGHDVKGYTIRQKSDRNQAYRELESLQQSAIASYQDWAHEEIKYDSFDSEASAQNLKQYNDTYTMSMLMGVIAPLENGCDVSSVLQCLMSYNIVRTLNPNLDMDSSRMYYNFKNTIAPLVADMKADHPVLGFLATPLTSGIDKTLAEAGGSKFATTIDAHQKVHDIDSMYLTPRQAAAIKLNFMEQYYTDLRSVDDPYRRNDLTAAYNKSIKHLQAICKNSGYDMSVEAAEERYLVAMKIEKNPDYMTMFSETFDVFGVKMNTEAINASERQTGQFISTDEHRWFGQNDITSNGAFHVRMPMTYDALQKDMNEHARDFNEMREYIKSPICPIAGTDNEQRLLKVIDSHEKQYNDRMLFIAKTDNIKNPKTGEIVSKKDADLMYGQARSRAKRDDSWAGAYADEVDLVTETKVIRNMGYNPAKMKDNERHKIDPASNEYKQMAAAISKKQEYDGIKDKSPEYTLQTMQYHYFEDLDSDDQYNLLAHAIANVEQGYKSHASDRDGMSLNGVASVASVLADLGLEDDNDLTEDQGPCESEDSSF